MNQLIVQIVDKNKAEMLSKFLTALDFVKSVEIQEQRETEINNDQDFFALARLWKDRTFTAETIRQQAWQENI